MGRNLFVGCIRGSDAIERTQRHSGHAPLDRKVKPTCRALRRSTWQSLADRLIYRLGKIGRFPPTSAAALIGLGRVVVALRGSCIEATKPLGRSQRRARFLGARTRHAFSQEWPVVDIRRSVDAEITTH
jgi:hypothetical protein